MQATPIQTSATVQMAARTGTEANRPTTIAVCGPHQASSLVVGLRSQSRALASVLVLTALYRHSKMPRCSRPTARTESAQPVHSKKNWQVSVGMVSVFASAQCGHVMVD